MDDLPLDVGDERTPSSVVHRLVNLMATKNNVRSVHRYNYKTLGCYSFYCRVWSATKTQSLSVSGCPTPSPKNATSARKSFRLFAVNIIAGCVARYFVQNAVIKWFLARSLTVLVSKTPYLKTIAQKRFLSPGDQKVCTYCSKIVLSYLKSSAVNSDLKSDLQALQDDLSSKLSAYNNQNMLPAEPSTSALHRKISVGYQEERLVSTMKPNLSKADRKHILQQSNSLKSIHEDMTKVLPLQNRGVDLVQYLIINHKSANHIQAIAILNAMIEAGFLIALLLPLPSTTSSVQLVPSNSDDDPSLMAEFNESVTYKLLRTDEIMTHSGSYQLDLDLEASSAHLSRPLPDTDMSFNEDSMQPNVKDNSFGFSTTKDLESQSLLLSTAGSKSLMQAFCSHEELLLSKLLKLIVHF